LLCSVGLDKLAYFYDINEKNSVQKLSFPFPVQSVSFCTDGKTIAFGSSNSGNISVYDLRNAKEALI
jgi:Tol biopolymer transport system component